MYYVCFPQVCERLVYPLSQTKENCKPTYCTADTDSSDNVSQYCKHNLLDSNFHDVFYAVIKLSHEYSLKLILIYQNIALYCKLCYIQLYCIFKNQRFIIHTTSKH